ncbi:hypothetical protein FA95DRAFT_1557980 [Auriscalpium vulgare]|uniref:Uncharacterized protein n=1 Tax=Auriscalpium vulgare TaxID=40419 RepID=A0ACB8RWI5_9AGAM|nr:hypothetical protein FA95DRAFT_1557980 [Auriscalpium vulgare]
MDATQAFMEAKEKIAEYQNLYKLQALADVRKILTDAKVKDAGMMKWSKRVMARFGAKPGAPFSGPLIRREFVLLRGLISDPAPGPPPIIVSQELDINTDIPAVLWIFSRFSKTDNRRITLKNNPHFYVEMPKAPSSFNSTFRLEPLKALNLNRSNTIYVIIDRTSRIFLEYGKINRTFGNIWRPDKTVILKDIAGLLEAADVTASDTVKDKPAEIWQRSKERAQTSVKVTNDWKDVLEQALISDGVDWLIRPERLRVEPPTEDWVPCSPVRERSGTTTFGSTYSVGGTASRSGHSSNRTRSRHHGAGASTTTLSSAHSNSQASRSTHPDASRYGSTAASSVTLSAADEPQTDTALASSNGPMTSTTSLALPKPSLVPRDSGIDLPDTAFVRGNIRDAGTPVANVSGPAASGAPPAGRDAVNAAAARSIPGSYPVDHRARAADGLADRAGQPTRSSNAAPAPATPSPLPASATPSRSESAPIDKAKAVQAQQQRAASTPFASSRPAPTPTLSAKLPPVPQFPSRQPTAFKQEPPSRPTTAPTMPPPRTNPTQTPPAPQAKSAPRATDVPQFRSIPPVHPPPPPPPSPRPTPTASVAPPPRAQPAPPPPPQKSWWRRHVVDPLANALNQKQ